VLLINVQEASIKKFALTALAAGMVLGETGTASAQYYDPGYRDYARYRDYDLPDPTTESAIANAATTKNGGPMGGKDTIGPAHTELGTSANKDGLIRTVSANLIGDNRLR
jgi:hypothetical protein